MQVIVLVLEVNAYSQNLSWLLAIPLSSDMGLVDILKTECE